MSQKIRKKFILGAILGSLYLLISVGEIFGTLVSLTAKEDVNGNPVDYNFLSWFFPLMLALLCLLAFACTLIKLKYQKLFVWFCFFDFLFFPVAIPFYYYVNATFKAPLTSTTINSRTIKKWAMIQFIGVSVIHSLDIIIWLLITILIFQDSVQSKEGLRGLDPDTAIVMVIGLVVMIVLAVGIVGALLMMSYALKEIKIPKWVIIFSLITPLGITWPLGLLLFDKRVKIHYATSYAANFQSTAENNDELKK